MVTIIIVLKGYQAQIFTSTIITTAFHTLPYSASVIVVNVLVVVVVVLVVAVVRKKKKKKKNNNVNSTEFSTCTYSSLTAYCCQLYGLLYFNYQLQWHTK